jgi:hypothetical protein
MVPIGSNNSAVCRCRIVVNLEGLRDLPTEESSPEKAGVGGSIPSLATNVLIDLQPLSSPRRHHWSPNGIQTRFDLRKLDSFCCQHSVVTIVPLDLIDFLITWYPW